MADILIIEDDPDIASLLRRGLATAGHKARHVDSAASAKAALADAPADAAIIDMMLGDERGSEVLATLRANGHQMPALMLSALSRVEERSEGLDAGAQDYIVKPFQFSELLARLEVQLRRIKPPEPIMTLGGLIWHHERRMVRSVSAPTGREVLLTEREGELLEWLIRRAGQVSTRGAIFDALWAQHGGSTENVVDVYVGYLRRKLGNFTAYGLNLRTLRGRGFVLEPFVAGQEESER